MFRDRQDAARQLAIELEHYKNKNALVLGIPRGGVETAYFAAGHLNAELSLVVTRKLGFPSNPEMAFGAIAEDGSYFIFDEAQSSLSPEIIQSVVAREEYEIERRIKILRGGVTLPDLKDRTVIIVDDGIATGATVFAAIKLCRNHGAGRVVVASPVSGSSTKILLEAMADEVLILYCPDYYYAVSQAYENFGDLDDKEVISFLNKGKQNFLHPEDN